MVMTEGYWLRCDVWCSLHEGRRFLWNIGDLPDCICHVKEYGNLYDTDTRRKEEIKVWELWFLLISAIAYMVSYWLLTAVGLVWSQVKLHTIYGGQSGIGAGFFQVRKFPMPVLIPSNAPYSSVSWDWYSTPISGRQSKWTGSHPTPQN
jgi:hypothetical protein